MTPFAKMLLALHRKDAPVFAVLDGAQFDNLPQELMLGDFVSRPLYLDRGDNDPEQVMTGPHLVWINERLDSPTGRGFKKTLPALLELIGDKPAAVFWQCPGGAEVLYRHLRGINMVRYPKDALDDWEEPDVELEDDEEPKEPDTHTLVTFRHADANVMAQVIPALEPAELSRLLGPAISVHFKPAREWAGGQDWIACARTDDLPMPPVGPLELSAASLEGIDEENAAASRDVVRQYLTEVAPEYTERLSPEELQDVILNAERVGTEIGLESEHGFGLWTYLALITGQDILQEPQVLAHFKNDPRPSDELVEELVDQIANASDEDLEAWI